MIDLALFRASFARVSDAYCVETPTSPLAVRDPLTDDLLQGHLDGGPRIGAYCIDAEGLADQIIIDIDIPRGKENDPKEWERARAAAKAVLAVYADLGIEAFITSSKSRGYHVRALWQLTFAAELRRLGNYIVRRAGIRAEVFPKQDERGEPDPETGLPGLGSLVWLPFHGDSLKAGKTAILDSGNGLAPMPDQWEALRDIRRNSIETLASVIAEMEESDPAPKAEKPSTGTRLPLDLIGIGFERCQALDRYKWNATEAGRLLPDDDPREHAARIALANYCRAFEGGAEWAVDAVFRHTEDYDPKETWKQIASLRGAPSRCDGEGLCPGGQCDAIKALGKQSPIAFAYDRRTEREAVPDIRLPSVPIGPKAPLFASLADLLANPRPQRWLVKDRIEAPSTVMVFGPSGSGKSFIAVDLAGTVATGGQWAGHAVVGGPVFYIVGEGRNGTLRRFRAWQLKRKVQIPEDRLFLSVVSIELNAAGAAEVALEVERRTKESGEPPALIIVDTLSRMMPAGDDENSVKDMMAFVKAVDQIRDRFDCVAVIVHHAGVADDKRARGSTSLKAAMDAELCVTRRGPVRAAEWTKLKDLPDEPHPQEFVLEPELLGQDEDGNLITSAVVEWKGRTTAKAITTTTKAESLGLETLRAASAGSDSATLGAWRTTFYTRHWGDNDDAKQKSFRRVRESLAGKKLITIDGDRYSIPRQGDRT